MVHVALGDPPRLAHQEILEEEQTHLEHTDDVLPMCSRIMEIAQTRIDEGIFPDGSGVRRVRDAIMAETQRTLLYRRHRRRIGGSMAEKVEEAEEVDKRLSDTYSSSLLLFYSSTMVCTLF